MNMPDVHTPGPGGLRLLSRRRFLSDTGAGLSAIALAHMLNQQGLLGAQDVGSDGRPLRKGGGPIRPQIDPARPMASRPPHMTPRAEKVLVIFCSGAISHIDTWD